MKKASITSGQKITGGQRVQFGRVVKDAALKGISVVLKKPWLDKESMGRILHRGDVFAKAIMDAVIDTSRLLAAELQFDKRKEGWELLEDVGFTPEITSIDQLEPVGVMKPEDAGPIHGEVMLTRSRGELRANLGQRHAEWLLDHQDQIPPKWRKHVLVFTGTVWRSPRGDRYVAYLYWDGGQWYLYWRWLFDGYWGGSVRVMRPRESNNPRVD